MAFFCVVVVAFLSVVGVLGLVSGESFLLLQKKLHMVVVCAKRVGMYVHL